MCRESYTNVVCDSRLCRGERWFDDIRKSNKKKCRRAKKEDLKTGVLEEGLDTFQQWAKIRFVYFMQKFL